jgi:hypothetical protein
MAPCSYISCYRRHARARRIPVSILTMAQQNCYCCCSPPKGTPSAATNSTRQCSGLDTETLEGEAAK